MKFSVKLSLIAFLIIGYNSNLMSSNGDKVELDSKTALEKTSTQQEIYYSRLYPLLSKVALTIAGGKPFFTVWHNTADKGLVFKVLLDDPNFKNLQNDELMGEIYKLFDSNKNQMTDEDLKYNQSLLAKQSFGKKIIAGSSEINDIFVRNMPIGLALEKFPQERDLIIIESAQKIIDKNKNRQISMNEMLELFKNLKKLFIFGQSTSTEETRLVEKIIDAYIQSAPAIANQK